MSRRWLLLALGVLVTTATIQDSVAQSYPANPQYQFADSATPTNSVPIFSQPPDSIQSLNSRLNSLECQLDTIRGTSEPECSGMICGGGLYGGAAAVFAKPHFKEAFQYSQTNLVTGLQTLFPFQYEYQATPRAWLGYKTADGFGVKVSWWDFDANGRTSSNTADGFNLYGAHAVNVIFPANIFAALPGETLTNQDSLKTQIQNYYLTFDQCLAGFDLSGGLGLRHAKLDQSFNSIVQDQTGAPIRQLNWERKYQGLGPAVAMEAKKKLGPTRLSFVGNAGGAFLFGTKSLNRTVLGDQSPQPASPFLALDGADEVVGIGELGMGLEWCRPLPRGHNLLIRGQYESQLWAEGGAPTLGFLGFEGIVVQVELKR